MKHHALKLRLTEIKRTVKKIQERKKCLTQNSVNCGALQNVCTWF
jgi:hypothetical protein